MKKNNSILIKIQAVFITVLICLIGVSGIIFSLLYIETFETGFVSQYLLSIKTVSVAVIITLTIATLAFSPSKKLVYKILFLIEGAIALVLLVLFMLKKSGFLERVDSIDSFRDYIASFGNLAVIVFIILQFLQVVVLPIPAFITVGAGVLLFGPLVGAIYSCIGIIAGSIVAYFIGRVLGYKVAAWLVGEKNLDKGLNAIKGKDKVVLTFMFLFPFFPDDVLCFVAGLTSISPLFFIVMIFITRIISVFATCFSMNNDIIPYNTWWGICLWVLFFALTIVLTIAIYKKGDKIEKLFTRRKNKEISDKK